LAPKIIEIMPNEKKPISNKNKSMEENYIEQAKANGSFEWPEHGYEIKSTYANSIIDTTAWVPCEDLKFREPVMKESIYKALDGRSWFSIGDRVLLERSGMKEVLQELYPNKSKYEI
jgi:hypothetical protein